MGAGLRALEKGRSQDWRLAMEKGRSQDLRLALGQVTVLESGPGASHSTKVWPLGRSQYLILALGKVTVLVSGA